MRRRLVSRPTHATVVAYAGLFVALGGGAYAATTNPTSVVRACYTTKSRSLRLARTGHCGRAQHPISWNQQGPVGPAGSQGSPGPPGSPGPTGTVDRSQFYTQSQSDARYLAVAGTAANSVELAGQPPSEFAQSSLFGSPLTWPPGRPAIRIASSARSS